MEYRRRQDLIVFYERAGFKHLGTGDVWGLNLEDGRPPRPTAPALIEDDAAE